MYCRSMNTGDLPDFINYTKHILCSNFNIRRINFNLLIAYCLFRKFEVNFMLESIIHVIYALKKVYLSTKYVISSVPEPSFFGWIRSRTFLIFVFLQLLIKLLMLVTKYIIWSRELEPKPKGFQKARGRTKNCSASKHWYSAD